LSEQLLVYVGGTLVLVVFGVMLTAQGPFITMKAGPAEWAIALVVGIMLYGVIAMSIVVGNAKPLGENVRTVVQGTAESDEPSTSVLLGEAFLGIKQATRPASITGAGMLHRERKQMGYLLPFEIVSVHLLVVLIGAAYLARAKRRRGASA
jgi:NADH-quinone oxidoreductase subunit J